MMNFSWSWCYDPEQLESTGRPHYEADGRTCVLPVKLVPRKAYTVWLNTTEYRNFRDAEGRSAVPYELKFSTRSDASGTGAGQRPAGVPLDKDRPKVISVFPAPDASGVDPVTVIRVKFDRPMDPDRMGLHSNILKGSAAWRLRRSPKYVEGTNEFVVPVALTPGAKDDLGLVRIGEKASDFQSVAGVAAPAYPWRFATGEAPPNPKVPKPRLVSVDPPLGARVGMVTVIRVRFDRPMDPEAFAPVCSFDEEEPAAERLLTTFSARYHAPSNSFTFLGSFPLAASPRIELRGFRGAEGGRRNR